MRVENGSDLLADFRLNMLSGSGFIVYDVWFRTSSLFIWRNPDIDTRFLTIRPNPEGGRSINMLSTARGKSTVIIHLIATGIYKVDLGY